MKNVMLDNWFMEDIFYTNDQERRIDFKKSRSYHDLLTAIILWDNIYYPKNNYNFWVGLPEAADILQIVHGIEDSKEEGKKLANRLYCKYEGIHPDDSFLSDWKYIDAESAMKCGALRYLILSNMNNCDYLPCKQRQEYLNGLSDSKCSIKNVRLDLLAALDKKIQDYYHEAYAELSKISEMTISLPVLSQYVIAKTPNQLSHLQYAAKLRKQSEVKRYRGYLGKIEAALEAQKWSDLRYLLSNYRDALSEVLKIDRSQIAGVKFSINPLPNLSFEYKNINDSISKSPSISIDLRLAKKFQLTFLRKVARYGRDELEVL